MKILLDTNVIISSIIFGGRCKLGVKDGDKVAFIEQGDQIVVVFGSPDEWTSVRAIGE